MAQSQLVRRAYGQSERQAKIHPVKLIYLMYERVIQHIELARQGIENKDPRVRGENLSRAIAIVTELNASIKEEDSTEAAQFLRGLYTAILTELPKVSISNDLEVLRLAHSYLTQLKGVWQETAMEEAGLNKKATFDGEGMDSTKAAAQEQAVKAGATTMGVSVAI